MSFYDEETKKMISQLGQEDQLALIESLFNGMVNSMKVYYATLGYSDKEIESLIDAEIKGVKSLIKKRISEMVEKPQKIKVEFARTEKTDDQFNNDAAIDLGLILSEFGVKKET